MTTDHTDNHKDFVRHVVEAFERMPFPPGPPVRETLELLRNQASQPSTLKIRPSPRSKLMRILAPVAVAVAAGIAVIVTLRPFGPEGVGFADVIKQIERTDAVGFKMTISKPGGPEVSGQGVALSPNFVRVDWKSGDRSVINITDHAKGEMIVLDPISKEARINKVPRSAMDFDVVRRLRTLDEKHARRIEPDEKTDPNVEVFEIREGNATGKMWVHKKTKLPIRYEMHGPEGLGLGSVVFSDFDWNAKVDPRMFEIPSGYTREVNRLLAEPIEEEFVQALRILHAFTDEPYSADFLTEDPGLRIGRAAYDQDLSREQNHARQLERLGDMIDTLGLTRQEAQDGKKLQARIDFLCMKADQFALRIESRGAWVGGGVKPGEADKPLCWWRPKGSDKVRVLYGDLTIRDADEPPKRR